jgi:hypothetical protein
MNPETSEALFMDPEEVVPLMEALSFTQYLLQQYGYDMFAGIYNEEDIQEKNKSYIWKVSNGVRGRVANVYKSRTIRVG